MRFRNTKTHYIDQYTILRTHACVDYRHTQQILNVAILQFRTKNNEANFAIELRKKSKRDVKKVRESKKRIKEAPD